MGHYTYTYICLLVCLFVSIIFLVAGLGLRKDVGAGSGLGHADTGQGLESEPLLREAAALGCDMFEALLDKTTRSVGRWSCIYRCR